MEVQPVSSGAYISGAGGLWFGTNDWACPGYGNGWNDVLVVGFPGTPAFVYENPAGKDQHWKKHEIFDEDLQALVTDATNKGEVSTGR